VGRGKGGGTRGGKKRGVKRKVWGRSFPRGGNKDFRSKDGKKKHSKGEKLKPYKKSAKAPRGTPENGAGITRGGSPMGKIEKGNGDRRNYVNESKAPPKGGGGQRE